MNLRKYKEFLNREFLKVGELPLKVISSVSSILWGSVAGLFSFVLFFANLVIIPVVMFYLLRDYDLINKKILSFIPERSQRTRLLSLIKEIDEVLAGFVRGQLMVGLDYVGAL